MHNALVNSSECVSFLCSKYKQKAFSYVVEVFKVS